MKRSPNEPLVHGRRPALMMLSLDAAFGNALGMVEYCIRKAWEAEWDFHAEMEEEAVKVFVRQLVQAARDAGMLDADVTDPTFEDSAAETN